MSKKIRYKLKKKRVKKFDYKNLTVLFVSIFIIVFITYFFVKYIVGVGENAENPDYLSLEMQLDEIEMFYKNGRYELVQFRLNKLFKEDDITKETFRDLTYIQLDLFFKSYQIDNAISFMKKYKKKFDKEEYSFLLSLCFYKQREFIKSIDEIEKYAYGKNVSMDIVALYSVNLYTLNKHKEALEYLEARLKNNENSVLNYNLAYLTYIEGDSNTALTRLAGVIDPVYDYNLNIKYNLLNSLIYFNQKKYDSSIKYLQNVKNTGLDGRTYYYNLMLAQSKMGLYKESVNYFDILDDSVDNHFVFEILSIMLYYSNQFDKFLYLYNRYKEKFIETGEYTYRKFYIDLMNCQILYKKGKKQKSYESYNYLLTKNLSSDMFSIVLPFYLEKLLANKLYKESEKVIKENIDRQDEKTGLIKYMVKTYVSWGKINKAKSFLVESFNPQENPFEYYFNSALIYYYLNDYENAIKDLNILLKIVDNQDNLDLIYYELAYISYIGKDFDISNNYLSKVNEKNNNVLLLELVNYYKLNNYKKVVEIYEKMELTDINNYIFSLYTGLAYYYVKDYKESVFILRNNLENITDIELKANIAIYIGNCYYYMGDLKSARLYYNEAKLINPSNIYGKMNLEKLIEGD